MNGHATVVVKVETVFKVTRSSRGSHVLNVNSRYSIRTGAPWNKICDDPWHHTHSLFARWILRSFLQDETTRETAELFRD